MRLVLRLLGFLFKLGILHREKLSDSPRSKAFRAIYEGTMSFLENVKIRTKVLLLVLPICLVGVLAAVVLSVQLKHADNEYGELISHQILASNDMARASRNMVAVPYRAYQVVAYPAGTTQLEQALAAYKDEKVRLMQRLESVKADLPHDADRVDALIRQVNEIAVLTDRAVDFGSRDENDQAGKLLAQADELVSPLVEDVRAWQEELTSAVDQASADLSSATYQTIVISLSIIGIVFSVGIVAALLISARGITNPISRLNQQMTALASGDTSAEIEGVGRGDELGSMASAVAVFRTNAVERQRLERETAQMRDLSEQERNQREAQKAEEAAQIQYAVDSLAGALGELANGNVDYRIENPFVAHLDALRENFNSSSAKLQSALRAVGENARGIDAGANEIRAAADDLSKRTEQQAASVEETAAALEQITTTVKDSSQRAEEVGQLVARARAGAERSGGVVRQAVVAMQQIERSSAEITNIIGVIDEIAFQTNLLALNAGVEAARAGDAGKGFAVVAQEVRELAQRSATAAKEIKELIITSGAQVRNGVELVGETGNALEVIVSEVQEINRHVSAIVDSAREQATGLQEINIAVNTMDQGTQQNAAMVEQQTAASHSLAREAASLNRLLEQFNLGELASPVSGVSADTRASMPHPSPARKLAGRLQRAFSGGAARQEHWGEF